MKKLAIALFFVLGFNCALPAQTPKQQLFDTLGVISEKFSTENDSLVITLVLQEKRCYEVRGYVYPDSLSNSQRIYPQVLPTSNDSQASYSLGFKLGDKKRFAYELVHKWADGYVHYSMNAHLKIVGDSLVVARTFWLDYKIESEDALFLELMGITSFQEKMEGDSVTVVVDVTEDTENYILGSSYQVVHGQLKDGQYFPQKFRPTMERLPNCIKIHYGRIRIVDSRNDAIMLTLSKHKDATLNWQKSLLPTGGYESSKSYFVYLKEKIPR